MVVVLLEQFADVVDVGMDQEQFVQEPAAVGLGQLAQQHLPKLSNIGNLTVISIDQAFLARLVEKLERSISWSITFTEGVCYLTIGEETLETVIRFLG